MKIYRRLKKKALKSMKTVSMFLKDNSLVKHRIV